MAKTCNGCGEFKKPEEFYTNPSSKDGRRSHCIVCSKRWYYRYYEKNRESLCAKTEAWRVQNMDLINENRRKWYARNPQLMRKHVDDWRARYPLKAAAHFAVMYALKGGHLQRSPCRTCGAQKVQAHHADYTKPLEVDWLCSRCHGRAHRSKDFDLK
jgi:ribosomal protein S27AE